MQKATFQNFGEWLKISGEDFQNPGNGLFLGG